MKQPHYLNHRKRLREKFQKFQDLGDFLSDYELLELLLSYAIPRKDTKPLAKNLIAQFGSFSAVLDGKIQDFVKIDGIGENSAVLICLVKKLFEIYLEKKMKKKDILSSPQAVVEFAKVKLGSYTYEVFMIIYLNVKNEVIDYEIIQKGTIDKSVVYPRQIIEKVLEHSASNILLIHNHPSGYSEPSHEDKNITQVIIDAAKTIDVKVLDHIIVTKNNYFSFKENNIF